MHVWNTEEMSEFYIDLRIISIKLVCKSLIMNELPSAEIRERNGPDEGWETPTLRSSEVKRKTKKNAKKWPEKWKVPIPNITEDKERKDLRRCDPLPMTGSKLTMGRTKAIVVFPQSTFL